MTIRKEEFMQTRSRALSFLALSFTAAALGLLAHPREARADAKLGYIDSARILAEYKVVEDAKKTFDQQATSWEKERAVMEAELDSLNAEYKNQELMLTESMKKEKKDQIAAKRNAYETFVQSIWGPDGKLAQKNQELMKPIIDKVNAILERIGTEEKYTMIFDAANGSVVYASPGVDLTPRVLEELNKGAQ
jgi:outer membrane protein